MHSLLRVILRHDVLLTLYTNTLTPFPPSLTTKRLLLLRECESGCKADGQRRGASDAYTNIGYTILPSSYQSADGQRRGASDDYEAAGNVRQTIHFEVGGDDEGHAHVPRHEDGPQRLH